jgi:hypothetical protein
MSTLTVNKTYLDGTALFEADLDNIINSLELYFNITKVGTTNIQDEAIITELLGSNSITAAKILDDAVVETKLASSAVTTAKVNDLAVTTDKIADGVVNASSLFGEEVAAAKFALTAPEITATAVNLTTGTLSETITTTGNPVLVILVPSTETADATLTNAFSSTQNTFPGSSENASIFVSLSRAGSMIASTNLLANQPIGDSTVCRFGLLPSSFLFIDLDLPPGTYTYTLSGEADTFLRCKMIVWELF